MSFSIGIVGLPNAGKSTLFKALTGLKVDIADYPFTTIKPNVGIVRVKDERLDKIARVVRPEKAIPAAVEFVDIAGLIKGAHKGEGLGNQFLAQIRNCRAMVQVVRCFNLPANKTAADEIDPQKEIDIIKNELELKDLESEEKENLLSQKPVIYLLNVDNKSRHRLPETTHLAINLQEELEITELSDEEKKELNIISRLDQLILACYNMLDLITFFSIAGLKEARAWPLKKGSTAPEAGDLVHSDFKEKFIRAEVVPWQELTQLKSWKKAKEAGKIKIVGRDYVVRDGDVIEFKI